MLSCSRRRCAIRGAAGVLGAVLCLAGAPLAVAATSLHAWGDNTGGELGNDSLTGSDVPIAVPAARGVTQVSAGYRFSLGLTASGTVVAWGENQYGQLGDGTWTDAATPIPVKSLSGVVAIAAGGGHSLALLSNGTVMAWGDNAFGQLGDGSTADSPAPVPVIGLSDVKAIAAGELDSVALLQNGTVVDWGDDRDGELGEGSFVNSDVPVAVKGLSGVSAISAGGLFNLALHSSGTVSAWGQGINGQLGDGSLEASTTPVPVDDLSGVSSIAAGNAFALAVLDNGTVDAWGDDAFDELGTPIGLNNSQDVPILIQGLSSVRAVAAGGESSLAVLDAGTVDAWGDGAMGQLGLGSTGEAATPQPLPGLAGVSAISNGASHALALVTGSSAAKARPRASAASTGALTPWRAQLTPNPGVTSPESTLDVFFTGVSAASPSAAWGVGETDTAGDGPMAEGWNGSRWRAANVPTPAGTTATLNGVDDLSPADAWAVGTSTSVSGGLERTLIEHWDGRSWQIVPSPNPAGTDAGTDELQAVSAVSPSDVWAVGEAFENLAGATIELLFEHWNGTAWTAAPLLPVGGDGFAEGITMISADDGWAVGTNSLESNLAAHWDGTAWSIVSVPSLRDGRSPLNTLTGVSATGPDDVWASGYEGNVPGTVTLKPVVLHYDGSSWTLTVPPNPGTEGSRLNAITAVSPTDAWAVGQTQETDGALLTLTEQFNGSAWTPVASPDPGQLGPITADTLDAVTSTGGVLWALGSQQILGECCLRTLALTDPAG